LATNVGNASLTVRVGIPEHKEQLQSLLSKFRLNEFRVALNIASSLQHIDSPLADYSASMRRLNKQQLREKQLLPFR
jgi:hypothetical protein